MHVQWKKWSHHNGIKFTSWAFHSRGTIWLFNFYYGTLDFITGNFSSFFLHFDGIEWQGKFWPYFDIRSPRFWTIRLIFFSWLHYYLYGDDGFTPTDPNDAIMISNDATFSHKIVISFEWQKIIIWKYILWLALYSVWGKGYFRNLISLPVCKRKSISYISDWTCSTIL